MEDNNIINVDTSKVVALWENKLAEKQFTRLCDLYDKSPKIKIENVVVQNHEIYVSAEFNNRSEKMFMILNYHDVHLDDPYFYYEFPEEKPSFIYSFYPNFSNLFDLKDKETVNRFREIITLAQAEAPEYDHPFIDKIKNIRFDKNTIIQPRFQNIRDIVSPLIEDKTDIDIDR